MTSTRNLGTDARRARLRPVSTRGRPEWPRNGIGPFLAFQAALAVQSVASAFVFITRAGQAEPWSRSLRPGLVRNDARLGRVMDLKYAFGNAGVPVDPGDDAGWGTADRRHQSPVQRGAAAERVVGGRSA